MNILERLNVIFCRVFDDPSIAIQRQTTANDIEGWDSLSHMNLIIAVEIEFQVKFALGELQSLKNVGSLVALIEKNLQKNKI